MADYALILAGGGGTRLWPLSRRDRPKQVLPLIGDRTMFQMSVERLDPLFTPEQIFVVTGLAHLETLQAQCPHLPPENFIVEPVGRDTGPAAGLGALHLYHHDPDAVVAVLTSDHYIGAPDRFRQALQAASDLARCGYVVALGITPSFPSSGYAYLERGEAVNTMEGLVCYRVVGFCEKPDPLTAAELVLSGKYSWNSGMLICRAEQALGEIHAQAPALGEALDQLALAMNRAEYATALAQLWPQVEKISIDQAIMKGAKNMVIVPVDIGWSDIGSWNTLYDVLRPDDPDADKNVLQGASADLVQLRTRGTLVFSDRAVVTIGLENVVIVDTPDVLLVCRRDQSEDVRQVVEMLKEQGHDAIL